jgi:hypothetical protein
MTSPAVREAIIKSYGEWALGYLEPIGEKGQEFISNCALHLHEFLPNLPTWQPTEKEALEIGGEATNELVLTSPATYDNGAWRELLAPHSSTPTEGANIDASLLVNRFFDPMLSEAVGAPMVGTTEALVFRISSTDPATYSIVLIPSTGEPREIAFYQDIEPPTGGAPNLPQLEPNVRIRAYPNYLVCRQDDKKVYAPIEQSVPTEQVNSRGDLGWLRYSTVTLGDPVAARPTDTNSRESSTGLYWDQVFASPTIDLRKDAPDEGGFDPPEKPKYRATTSGGALVVVAGAARQPEAIIYHEGGLGQSGFGPEGLAFPGYGGCTHFNVRDTCYECCNGVMTTGISIVIGAGVACHAASSICIPCHIACGIVEGVAIGALIYGQGQCRRNCERAVSW